MGKNEAIELSPVAVLLDEAVRELRVRGSVEQRYSPDECARLAGVDEATVFLWKREYESSQGKGGLGPWEKLGHRTVRVRGSVFDAFLRSKEVVAPRANSAVMAKGKGHRHE